MQDFFGNPVDVHFITYTVNYYRESTVENICFKISLEHKKRFKN